MDHTSLARIRQEAYSTQEALIVEEQKEASYLSQIPVRQSSAEHSIFADNMAENVIEHSTQHPAEQSDTKPSNAGEYDMYQSDAGEYDTMSTSEADIWVSLGQALKEKELQALAVILQVDGSTYTNIKEFADHNNIMLEVLVDGINEKAMDYIGDNILDDDFIIYEDYEEQVKGMVEQI